MTMVVRETRRVAVVNECTLSGLWCMYSYLSIRSDGSSGILQQTDYRGGRCNMSIENNEDNIQT